MRFLMSSRRRSSTTWSRPVQLSRAGGDSTPPEASLLQNAVAVLAVMAAIAMLVLTLVSPRASLLLIETPAAYTEAS
jgi:hypothetical protein